MRANAARLAFGGCQSPASIAFIYGNGELPLLKPSKGAILPPNLLESGECRLKVLHWLDGQFQTEILPTDVVSDTGRI
jgi:hypothetical protein